MSEDGHGDSPKDFGATFRGFLQSVAAQAPDEEPVFRKRIREHFDRDPDTLSTISADFPPTERANLSIAVDAYLARPGVDSRMMGVAVEHEYHGVTLASLIAPTRAGLMGGGGPTQGPVSYADLAIGPDATRACVQRALFFVRQEQGPFVALMTGPAAHDFRGAVHIEVIALDRSVAERFLGEVRSEARRCSIYRQRVLSLELNEMHQQTVHFHQLPPVSRDQIVLPAGMLERIERLADGVTRHSAKLKAAGRHLKRGLLFHGPPGTGKTLTAMYLAGQVGARTVIILTGRGMGLIESSCQLARQLQPAMIILEDVDLIAERRESQQPGCSAVLFELLNQMDGLGDDADVLFVLTTNNPQALEPALAARPGRIDQAFEIALPDEAGRTRLLDLYARGLTLELTDRARWIAQTQGASGAFIKELLRKAALLAAEEAETIVVRDGHVEAALREMVMDGVLTRSLLGASGVGAPSTSS